MNNKSKRVEARIPGDLYKRLVEAAAKQKGPNKSVSHLIVTFVERSLKRR